MHAPFISQKRKEMESAILKNVKFTEEQREKWMKVVRNEFMSSIRQKNYILLKLSRIDVAHY